VRASHSQQTKEKMRIKALGEKNSQWKGHPWIGRHHTEETKRKISTKKRGGEY